jgi:hypothetical protein
MNYQSNILHVDVEIALSNGLVILPAGLPGYERPNSDQSQTADDIKIGACVVLDIPGLLLQFRLHDYFMGDCAFIFGGYMLLADRHTDLSLNVDTTFGYIENNCSEPVAICPASSNRVTTLLIDGEIDSHQVFPLKHDTLT